MELKHIHTLTDRRFGRKAEVYPYIHHLSLTCLWVVMVTIIIKYNHLCPNDLYLSSICTTFRQRYTGDNKED